MISAFNRIEELFKKIDRPMNKKIGVFLIGGAVLLHQGLKPATKDIDIVVEKSDEFLELQRVLKTLGFLPKIPGAVYGHMNLNQIFQRDDFRIDLFQKEVCGKFSLPEEMMERAKTILVLEHLKVFSCSNEDIFLLKTMTEREGDLEDCISIAQTGIDWDVVLHELKHQIEESKRDVWTTWVGERLDLLEERGLTISIMAEINRLRGEFFKRLAIRSQ